MSLNVVVLITDKVLKERIISIINTSGNNPSPSEGQQSGESVVIMDSGGWKEVIENSTDNSKRAGNNTILLYRPEEAAWAAVRLNEGVLSIMPATAASDKILKAIAKASESIRVNNSLEEARTALKKARRSHEPSVRTGENRFIVPYPSPQGKDGINSIINTLSQAFPFVSELFSTRKPRIFEREQDKTSSAAEALELSISKNAEQITKKGLTITRDLDKDLVLPFSLETAAVLFSNFVLLMLAVPGSNRRLEFSSIRSNNVQKLLVSGGPLPVSGRELKRLAEEQQKVAKGPIPLPAALWKEINGIVHTSGGQLEVAELKSRQIKIEIGFPAIVERRD